MAISRRAMQNHVQAMELIHSDTKLTPEQVDFCFENIHEAANGATRLAGAHFTPPDLATDLAANISIDSSGVVLDVCAGIGMLSRAFRDYHAFAGAPRIIAIELNDEFRAIGKRLLPEVEWVKADILDPGAAETIRAMISGHAVVAAISNPPFGRIATDKGSTANAEYAAISFAQACGAGFGAFIIPQMSCPFAYSGRQSYASLPDNRKYQTFARETGITLEMNAGFDTSTYDGDWKSVSPRVEIAIVEFPPLPLHQAA